MIEEYRKFLKSKCRLAEELGYRITPTDVHPMLKPHQKDSVQWMVQGGRRALFASLLMRGKPSAKRSNTLESLEMELGVSSQRPTWTTRNDPRRTGPRTE